MKSTVEELDIQVTFPASYIKRSMKERVNSICRNSQGNLLKDCYDFIFTPCTFCWAILTLKTTINQRDKFYDLQNKHLEFSRDQFKEASYAIPNEFESKNLLPKILSRIDNTQIRNEYCLIH